MMANNVPLVPIGGIASSSGSLAAPGSLYKTLADESVARKKLLQDKQYRDEQLLLQKAQEERAISAEGRAATKFAGEQAQAEALKELNIGLTDMSTTGKRQREQVDYKLSDAQVAGKIAAQKEQEGIYAGAEGDFARMKQTYMDKLRAGEVEQPVGQGEKDIRQAPATLLGGGTLDTEGLVFPWQKKPTRLAAIPKADVVLDVAKDTTTAKQEDKILTDRADKLATTEFLAGFSQKYDMPYAALEKEITTGDKLNSKTEKVITKLEGFEDVKLTPAEMNKKRGDLIRRSNVPEATKKLLKDAYGLVSKELSVSDAIKVKEYQDTQNTLATLVKKKAIPEGITDMAGAKMWLNKVKTAGSGMGIAKLLSNLDTWTIFGWSKGGAQDAITKAREQGYYDNDILGALTAGSDDGSISKSAFNDYLAGSKKKEQ